MCRNEGVACRTVTFSRASSGTRTCGANLTSCETSSSRAPLLRETKRSTTCAVRIRPLVRSINYMEENKKLIYNSSGVPKDRTSMEKP